MSFRPSLRPDPGKKSAGEELALEPAAPTSGPDAAQEIATLARALANAGGGELSLDLAVDLVLNETVEQARQATRATGAAIAGDFADAGREKSDQPGRGMSTGPPRARVENHRDIEHPDSWRSGGTMLRTTPEGEERWITNEAAG